MWPPWGKSPRGGAVASASPRAALNPSFSFSSFKDINALLNDDSAASSSAARKPSVFHRVRIASTALRAWRSLPAPPPPAGDKLVVLYFTSLRVVRRTFDDCRAVRSILRGLRLAVDERDLSMDSGFLAELKAALGLKERPSLPQVFVGGRYVGGADEIRQLHESGELKRLVEGAKVAPAAACEVCGGVRFVLCRGCSGSKKCYNEKGGGFRSCAACNENGLVRCPDCSAAAGSDLGKSTGKVSLGISNFVEGQNCNL